MTCGKREVCREVQRGRVKQPRGVEPQQRDQGVAAEMKGGEPKDRRGPGVCGREERGRLRVGRQRTEVWLKMGKEKEAIPR